MDTYTAYEFWGAGSVGLHVDGKNANSVAPVRYTNFSRYVFFLPQNQLRNAVGLCGIETKNAFQSFDKLITFIVNLTIN
jgi:hypothetical protein